MDTRGLPVLAVGRARAAEYDPAAWPYRLPCVRQVLEDGLELGALTVLVGENGTGKSTLVEGIAQQFGLSPEGGTTQGHHSTRPTESPLWHALWLRRGIAASKWGFFLRAETMHGWYSYIEEHGDRSRFHELSHGESFLEVLSSRFTGPGLFVLDEPEAALSFTGQLALVGLLRDIARSETTQAIVATHSPVVAATPGARILEITDAGLVERQWRDLDLVQHWAGFLTDPDSYFRYLDADDDDAD